MGNFWLTNRVLWALFTVLITLTYFHLHRKLNDALANSRVVDHYTCSPLPFGEDKMINTYYEFNRQTRRIAQKFHQMSQNYRDSKEARAQLKDMANQMEARLNVMSHLIGEAEHRRGRLIHLAELLQHQLQQLQFPTDCAKAKFVTTELPGCGFGCQVHHAALAFQKAFALNRTLLIYGNHWFDNVYPITHCLRASSEAIFQPIIRSGLNIGPTSPPALRKDWAAALKDIHSYPYAWFRGQLIRFILRLKPTAFKGSFEKDLDADKAISPLIGVHIRRTDKLIQEAEYVPLSTYMEGVDRIYQRLEIEEDLLSSSNEEGGSLQRNVYLASDDPSVFKEAYENYPQYRFLGGAKAGSQVRRRRSRQGLHSILYDILRLANCDYVVCTLSSNICRLVYELILTDPRHYGDRSSHVLSVDVPYSMHGQKNRSWTVITTSSIGGAKRGHVVRVSKDFFNGSTMTDTGKILPTYVLEENAIILSDNLY